MQLNYVFELERLYGEGFPLVKLPLQPFEVKGVDALMKVESQLFPR
jgi:hypothetical protein